MNIKISHSQSKNEVGIKFLPPTQEIYEVLVQAYAFFNEHLFENKLPNNCVISIRACGRTAAYYSQNRFANRESKAISHEIAFNPEYFGVTPIIETMQSLCHELCHMHQILFGEPSRRSYHNREWADHMISIGLMPSDTGAKGGKETGQSMGDYPIPGGKFELLCRELFKEGCYVRWYERIVSKKKMAEITSDLEASEEDQDAGENVLLTYVQQQGDEEEIALIQQMTEVNLTEVEFQVVDKDASAGRVKFQCPSCKANIWAKPSNKSICGECYLNYKKIILYKSCTVDDEDDSDDAENA